VLFQTLVNITECDKLGILKHSCMVNFSVIQVKVVAPEKPLEVNTFLKIPWCRLYCLCCLKISLCWYGQLRYPKILYVDLGPRSKPNNCPRFKTHAVLSPSIFSPSLPNPQYLVLSFCAFCLTPRYILPALIHIKSAWCLNMISIDNKHLRTHLLFHLAL